MRKIGRKLMVLAVMLLAIMGACVTVQAGTTVKTVKLVRTYNGNRQYCTIKGLSKTGKKVWSHKCPSATMTELCHVSIKTKGKSVYVIEGRNFLRLSKQTGKVLVNKKNVFKYIPGSATMLVDKNGCLYLMGYYGSDVYKMNKNGKIIWKKTLNQNAIWPYKMTKSGNYLRVYFSAEWGYSKAVLNAKTGKVTKYVW